MNTNELKTQLMQYIECAPNDEMILQRMLDNMQAAVKASSYRPMIYYDDVGKIINKQSRTIIPIVCDDMIEYVTTDGQKTMSLGGFICNLFDVDEDVAKAINNNLYYGISLLEQRDNENYSHYIYDKIKEEQSNFRLRDSVKVFLDKGDFPVIVATFGFPVIESALTKKGYKDKWFDPRCRNDIPFVKDDNSRVVYHVFGGEEPGSWVYNEQTMLTFIHALHSEDYGAKNLANYIRGIRSSDRKHPLVLGSSFPDWLFRFFVYPMYGDELNKTNGYWLSLSEIETGLDMFLKCYQYKGLTNLQKGSRVDSILEVAALSGNKQNAIQTNIEGKSKPSIFISYKRVNGDTPEVVKRIVELLDNQGYDIWIDTQKVQDAGNPYWANIKKAIKGCQIFIPLITNSYLNDYANAVDLDQLATEPMMDAVGENCKDAECIWKLKPIVREAYYAIAYKKKCTSIIVYDEKENIDGGTIEKIFNDPGDKRKLPTKLFGEKGARTYLVHNDKNPQFFNFPNYDE